MISFYEPHRLLLLLLLPLIIYLYKQYLDAKKKAAVKFSSLHLIKKTASNKQYRLHLPFILLILILTSMIIGLADPRIPWKVAKEGINFVLVIDNSGSMSANDYKPTRLEAAKEASELLINSLTEKDNIGIIIFGNGASTASYLTPFKEKAIEKLRSIQQKQDATAIGDGLSLAVDMATSIPNKKKVIILLSDGVNNAGVINPIDAAQFARLNNIQVYTIGMGSDKPVILGYDFFGNPQYAQLDENTLKEIAKITNAKYYKSINEQTLKEIYKNISNNIKREWEKISIKDFFYLLALILLLFNIYIIYGKYRIII